jgi:hypothetical protein
MFLAVSFSPSTKKAIGALITTETAPSGVISAGRAWSGKQASHQECRNLPSPARSHRRACTATDFTDVGNVETEGEEEGEG